MVDDIRIGDGLRRPEGLAGVLRRDGRASVPDLIQDVLALRLHPGHLVLMDKLRVHDSPATEAAVQRAGAKEVQLSPCSPDYSPIEEMWSELKARLRRIAHRTALASYQAIIHASEHITSQDFCGCSSIQDCLQSRHTLL